VVGAGPAGLAAALAGAASGQGVWLVEQESLPGGQLLWRDEQVEGQPGHAWAAAALDRLRALPNVAVKLGTQAAAYYDHNTLALTERLAEPAPGWGPERLWLVRAGRVVLATGALERPIAFPDNDRPGVMLASAAATYVGRFGVLPGRRIVLLTNNDDGYASALVLRRAGADVGIVDVRPQVEGALIEAAALAGIEVLPGRALLGVEGVNAVHGVRIGAADTSDARAKGQSFACDLVAVSGGWSPAAHLYSQAGGRLAWDAGLVCFRPARPAQAAASAGAANGAFELAAALAEGHAAGGGQGAPPAVDKADPAYRAAAWWRLPVKGVRQWIDYQHDVTTKDVELAAREGYVSVEHLKRYTTLGMATDQGKTANVVGLAVMGEETGRAPGEVGTTTFRPPYTPLTMGAIAGLSRGSRLATRRHLPLHAAHVAVGAAFRDYGAWYRPGCYPRPGESEAQAIEREVLAVRRNVGLMDGSSLGKIEVVGPDAAEFVNRIYYNELKSLKPGRLRYCLLLAEKGTVFDDGVVARLAPDRYLLSPSSSHSDGVMSLLEEWHQGEWPELKVFFHNVTQAWATLAISGPRAREVMAKLATDIDLSDAALPHMALAEGRIEGVTARVARVSFTGERSYEISVPASHGAALWEHLLALGRFASITPYGIESLMTLRTEKGYILIGRDTDGVTLPQDLGVSGPMKSKPIDYVGRRSLFTPEARRPDRKQLIGLAAEDPARPLPNGAHVVGRGARNAIRSLGFVTSSFASPTLGRPVALALVERGQQLVRAGARLEVYHLGQRLHARAVEPCFYDPKGVRLNA
jgi:sarcosine oxidase subunit alpha